MDISKTIFCSPECSHLQDHRNRAKVENYGMMCIYILFRNFINNGATPFTFEDLCFQRQQQLRRLDFNANNANNCDHKCINCAVALDC